MAVSAAKTVSGFVECQAQKTFLRSFLVRLITIQAEIDRAVGYSVPLDRCAHFQVQGWAKMWRDVLITKPAEAIP